MMLSNIQTLIFDCDGVILDSNAVKTNAFYQAALPYGKKTAQALVEWHISNGGISRYVKFDHFLNQIVPKGKNGPDINQLLATYASEVRKGLMTCAVAPGLKELRERTRGVRWLVVSGGDQIELNEIFAARGLASMYDGGIFGSPDTKDHILARELESGNIRQPALFLGDSSYDHQAASKVGLQFVFVSGWSELKGWQDYALSHKLKFITSIKYLHLL